MGRIPWVTAPGGVAGWPLLEAAQVGAHGEEVGLAGARGGEGGQGRRLGPGGQVVEQVGP